MIETMTAIFRPFALIYFKHTHSTIDVALSVFFVFTRTCAQSSTYHREMNGLKVCELKFTQVKITENFKKKHQWNLLIYYIGNAILFIILFLNFSHMVLPLVNIAWCEKCCRIHDSVNFQNVWSNKTNLSISFFTCEKI